MIRRIVSVIATILGLVVIALAVCSATIWRPSTTVQATLAQTPDQHYVLTEPGVLGLVDPSVTITATAEGQPVFLAVAYTVDAKAWLADDPYLSVTGLTDWNTLSATPVTERCETADPASAAPTQTASPGADATAATQAPAEAATGGATDGATADSSGSGGGCTTLADSNADPSQADLWLKTASGQSTVTLENVVEPDTVLLAATDGSGPAPRITLSWPRTVSTPWLIPGIIVGGLLLLAGVFGLLIDIQMRRADSQRRQRASERAARMATADSVTTAGLPRVEDPDRPLTRREVREKERAEAAGEEWMDPRTGVVYIDGVEAPEVPLASESEPGYDSVPKTGYDSDFGYNPAPGSDYGSPGSEPVPGPGYDSDFSYDSAPDSGYGPAVSGSAPEGDYGAQPAPEAGYGAQPEAGYGAAPWADQPASGSEAGYDDGAVPDSGFGAQFQADYGAQPGSDYGAAPGSVPEADYGAQPDSGYGAAPGSVPEADYGAQPGPEAGYGAQQDAGYGAQPEAGYGAVPWADQPASGSEAGYDDGSAPGSGFGAQFQTDYGAQPAPDAGYGAQPVSGYGAQPDTGYGAQPEAGYGAAPDSGYGPAPWAGHPPFDRLSEPDPGAARGGVPGFDEQATAAYRTSRELDDTNPLGRVPGTDGAGDDDEENAR